MKISHISTKTALFDNAEMKDAFQVLARVGHPFTVWVDLLGVVFPIPFKNGTCANAKVERCVQELLRREFGNEVHFA